MKKMGDRKRRIRVGGGPPGPKGGIGGGGGKGKKGKKRKKKNLRGKRRNQKKKRPAGYRKRGEIRDIDGDKKEKGGCDRRCWEPTSEGIRHKTKAETEKKVGANE